MDSLPTASPSRATGVRLVTALALLSLGAAACSSDPDAAEASAGGGDSASAQAGVGGASTAATTSSSATTAGAGGGAASMGCGKAATDALGGVQVTLDAGPEGDGSRGFYLSLPSDYDPSVPYSLILGYPGTDWVGKQIQPYLALEDGEPSAHEIFVYPDPLWRDFPGWGNYGGWVLGPNAYPAEGEGDLVFTEAILDYMEDTYCIDTARVFVTGHSWGGDMAQVVSCFLGDRITASVPVAANRPYWFEEPGGGQTDCVGQTAVWTMFGQADDHFTSQAYPGEYGDECRDFWLQERGCEGKDSFTDLGIGAAGECVEYEGCSSPTRYCLYGPATAHQVPSYFSKTTMDFFRSF